MSDCLFCKIANGEIRTNFLYEDDLVVAFPDENITDNVPAETLAAIAHAVKVVTEQTGIDKTGFRCITNTGDDGGQSVHHLHVHVLGGRKLDPNAGEGK